MNRQKLITILATIILITTMTTSLFLAQPSVTASTTYNADNLTVNGVLATDNYALYPFDKGNFIFGISKYGELVNGQAKVGLKYDGLDVFANPNVLEKDWSQGWLIDIHYADLENHYQNVWAYALYSDLSGSAGIGGDWKEGSVNGPLGTPYGGRKTNAWTTTDPIKILYDGPRRFVALTKTTIYSNSDKTSDDALVSITITFVFDKVKKNVILFKDIKRLDQGKFGRTFQVEFSNRGEWDIGTTSAPPSYAHFYDNLSTVYNHDYHDFYNAAHDITGYDMCQMIDEDGSYVGYAAFWPQLFGKLVDGTTHITRSTILNSITTVTKNETWATIGTDGGDSSWYIDIPGLGWPHSDPYPIGLGDVDDEPMVFKNGILLTGSDVDYTWTGSSTDIIDFTVEPADTDYITIVYKTLVNEGDDDMSDHAAEPNTPYVIGEWCFDLKNQDHMRQFRAVTEYGLMYRHDADDDDWGTDNVIDCEVQYYLNETFNPYDLYSAVEKQESRWLYYDESLTTATSYITLTDGLDDDIWCDKTDLAWSGYKLQSGDNGTAGWVNEFEDGIDAYSKNWALRLSAINDTDTATGEDYARVRITPTGFGQNGIYYFGNLTEISFWYKNITGAVGTYGPHIFVKLSNGTAGNEVNVQMYDNGVPSTTGWVKVDLSNIATFTGQTADNSFWYYADTWTQTNKMGGLPMYEGGTLASFDFYRNKLADYYVTDICVEVGYNLASGINGTYLIDDIDVGYLTGTDSIRYERVYNMEEDKLIPSSWNAYNSFAESVLVDGVLIDRSPYHLLRNYVEGGHAPYYTINFETGTITFSHWVTSAYVTWTLPIGTHIKVLYSTIEENAKGRYEWMVVGKNAAAIDSIGAAYMTEAFDSIKDIEVLLTGLDINDTVNGPHAPFVMGGAVTGTRSNYYFDYPSDNRSGLRDDWCTTYPVASSNMLFAGGPRAQLGTEYFNEFTMAFFAMSEYVVNDTGQANKIMGLSCWNRTTYGAGYAVVSVYKDLNGTIGFLIWGYNGEDTYYAAKWFWDEGIEYLQTENRGVTDIILEIDYTTCPYTVSKVERLGTISEKTPHDC